MHSGAKLCLFAMVTFTLASCATTGQDDRSPSAPFKSLAIWAGFATNAEEPADFVKANRPKGKLDYLPVGVTPPDPKLKAKKLTPEELKALEDDLEAARQKNATSGGIAP
jgi:hypothetical protein